MRLSLVVATRPRRRMVVAVEFLALLLAGATSLSSNGQDILPLQVAIWAEFVACLAMGSLGWSCGLTWNQLGPLDERQRQRWTESKALAYQALLVVLFPLVFWFGLTQIGASTWVEVSPARRGLLTGVLLITLMSLPIAIAGWREPDLPEEQ